MKSTFRFSRPDSFRLKSVDPEFLEDVNKDKARLETTQLCQRIDRIQDKLYANGKQALLLVFQGMDTSGKDGSIRRLLEFVDPAGVEVTSFKVPSAEERAHDFLWRVHRAVPRYGNIGVFNRSHYEDVLVSRVLKLVGKKVWKARYAQINAFEKHLSENGVLVLKFFLHISREEQSKRLQARLDDPKKHWKFSASDLEMRQYWDDFMEAYEEAVNQCAKPWAPWHVIPANHKWSRDLLIARTVVRSLESLRLKWPRAKEDLSKIRIS